MHEICMKPKYMLIFGLFTISCISLYSQDKLPQHLALFLENTCTSNCQTISGTNNKNKIRYHDYFFEKL